MRRQYPDFSDVVNPDTLALFEEQEPELAATIADSKDPYKMGIQSYKYIKALGLVSKAPEARHAKEVDKKLEKNQFPFAGPFKVMRNGKDVSMDDVKMGDQIVV